MLSEPEKMGHVIGVRNRKGSLNVQSGLSNLRLVALHRSLVVQMTCYTYAPMARSRSSTDLLLIPSPAAP